MDNIEREYRDYLIGLVEPVGRDYQFLLEVLWKKEFYIVIPNDENRFQDGINLRKEVGLHPYEFGPCRVLEALIGVANCYEFEVCNGFKLKKNLYKIDESYENVEYSIKEDLDDLIERRRKLFWILLENLGLSYYSRQNWNNTHVLVEIDEIIETWLSRRFKRNGEGSIFPLKNPKRDMRKIEIWYHLQAYIMENHL